MTSILAFDTSQQYTAIALSQQGVVIDHSCQHMPSGHSDYLLPAIMDMLTKHHLTLKDIDRIVTIVGPGSFTGLRVCMAAAQGMGVALKKDIIGITSLQAFAYCIETSRKILVVIDSQKQDIYCQFFSADQQALSEPMAIHPDEFPHLPFDDFILTGTATQKAHSLFLGTNKLYDVQEVSIDQMCQKLSLIATQPQFIDYKPIRPIYLKEALKQK
ncbi:MAG: tRNA (adenosine(37)-N6)-threonylcarbamoyltransferase complex dimerization subunit type 1 TsaB [Alphaproteobacteria bacterium]|nr:tRNA (adenosine(37)-N6)-threonylcarbamoyltransferase complex dimerization subunit type 1 TsaB [Alphaproteobacteria bacterium]